MTRTRIRNTGCFNGVGCAGRHDADDGEWVCRKYTPESGTGPLGGMFYGYLLIEWDRQGAVTSHRINMGWGPECGFRKL